MPAAMRGGVLEYLRKECGRGPFHLTLIDPDKQPPGVAGELAGAASRAGSRGIMVGGSTGVRPEVLEASVREIKRAAPRLPVILFPSGASGLCPSADAVFFMSLLNSRSPRFLVREQAAGARYIRKLGIEPVPMGYIVTEPGMRVGEVGEADLVPAGGAGARTAADYALAAEFFGMAFVYLEAGSGAHTPVPVETIREVAGVLSIPLIVGGGIRKPAQAAAAVAAGAHIVVTGTLVEEAEEREAALRAVIRKMKDEG